MNTIEAAKQILMSNEAAQINFVLYSIPFCGIYFSEIASGLEVDFFVTEDKTLLARGVGGEYLCGTNVFQIPPRTNSREWNATIIHEAVHAWFDKSKISIPAYQEESIAYIAEAIYKRKTGFSRNRIKSPIHLKAWSVANSILRKQMPDNLELELLKIDILCSRTYKSVGMKETSVYKNDG